jgi:hypothetical protein
VKLCAKNFDAKHQLVKLKEERKTQVPQTPLTFKRMMCLPEPTNIHKIYEVDAFSDAHVMVLVLNLDKWISQPKQNISNLYHVNISEFEKPY